MEADLDLSAWPHYLRGLGKQLAEDYGRGKVSEKLKHALEFAFPDAVFFSLQLFLSPSILVSQRNMLCKGHCVVDLLSASKSLSGAVGNKGQIVVHPLGTRHGHMNDLEDLTLSWPQLDRGHVSQPQGMPMVVCCPLIWSMDWEEVMEMASTSTSASDGVPRCESLLGKLRDNAICNCLGSVTLAVKIKDVEHLDRIMANLVLTSAAVAPLITFKAQQLLEDMGIVANVTKYGQECQYVPGTGWKQCSNEGNSSNEDGNSGIDAIDDGECIQVKHDKAAELPSTCKAACGGNGGAPDDQEGSNGDAALLVGGLHSGHRTNEHDQASEASNWASAGGTGEDCGDAQRLAIVASAEKVVEDPSPALAAPQRDFTQHPLWMYFINAEEENWFAERAAQQLSQFDRSRGKYNIVIVVLIFAMHFKWKPLEVCAEILQAAVLFYCSQCGWWSSARRDYYVSLMGLWRLFGWMYFVFPSMWRAGLQFTPFPHGIAALSMASMQVRFPFLCGLLATHLLIFTLYVHPNHCTIVKPSMDFWSCRGVLLLLTLAATAGSCVATICLEKARRKNYIESRTAAIS